MRTSAAPSSDALARDVPDDTMAVERSPESIREGDALPRDQDSGQEAEGVGAGFERASPAAELHIHHIYFC